MSWGEMFRSLIERELDPAGVACVTSDDHVGLRNALQRYLASRNTATLSNALPAERWRQGPTTRSRCGSRAASRCVLRRTTRKRSGEPTR